MRVAQLRGAQTMQDIDLAVRDLRAPRRPRRHDRADGADPHGPAAARRPAVAAGQLRPGAGGRRRHQRRDRGGHGRQGRQGDRRHHRRDHPGRGGRADRRRGDRVLRRPRLLPRLRQHRADRRHDVPPRPGARQERRQRAHGRRLQRDGRRAARRDRRDLRLLGGALPALRQHPGADRHQQPLPELLLERRGARAPGHQGHHRRRAGRPQPGRPPADGRHARHGARPAGQPRELVRHHRRLVRRGPQISAYASNDFGESTNISQTLDGTVIYDSELEVQPTHRRPG